MSSSITLCCILRQAWCFTFFLSLASQLSSGSSCLCLPCTGIIGGLSHAAGFYVGSRNQYSSPQTYKAVPIPSEPHPPAVCILIKMRSAIAQAVFELLDSSNPPASASQVGGTIGICHHTGHKQMFISEFYFKIQQTCKGCTIKSLQSSPSVSLGPSLLVCLSTNISEYMLQIRVVVYLRVVC